MGDIFTLLVLTSLQVVLGFDNLLYVSIESKRVSPDRQQFVRRMGIGLAIVFRIILLFVVTKMLATFRDPFFSFGSPELASGAISVRALIVLFGGGFILYTAVKEISHLLVIDDLAAGDDSHKRTVGSAIFWIVLMNLVFSFDSILSAVALTDVFWVMAVAVITSGVLMIVLADRVADFLEKNRMFEVLGLFVLFIVGVMLVSEGGHLAELSFFGFHVTPMTKTTFYFVLAALLVVDIIQSKYQKKLNARKRPNAKVDAGAA